MKPVYLPLMYVKQIVVCWFLAHKQNILRGIFPGVLWCESLEVKH